MAWNDLIGRVEIEPSIYAANFADLGAQLETLVDAGVRVFHFDIGDGHFVETITIGPIVLQSIAPAVKARGGAFDCHLMVSEPERQFGQLKEAGADSVTFHVEATADPARAVALARDLGLGVGIAFNPETSVEHVVAAAEGVELVLCMSINPGLSGQAFMPEALGRIEALRRLLPPGVHIQVDGGISAKNVQRVREAGANLLVAGSAIFWHEDISAAYRALATKAG